MARRSSRSAFGNRTSAAGKAANAAASAAASSGASRSQQVAAGRAAASSSSSTTRAVATKQAVTKTATAAKAALTSAQQRGVERAKALSAKGVALNEQGQTYLGLSAGTQKAAERLQTLAEVPEDQLYQMDDQAYLKWEADVKAAEEAFNKQANEDDFLRLITLLPYEDRDKAMSGFGAFRSLPTGEQKGYIDALRTAAEKATGQKFELDKTRLEQDYSYEKGKIAAQRNFAQQNYDKLIQTTDFNALREKAKENRTLAQALGRITSSAFVSGVAGSGIVGRRARMQREETQMNIEDIDIEKGQTQQSAQQALNQFVQTTQTELDRKAVLQARGEFDIGQANKVDTESLLISLFGNTISDVGNQTRAAITPSAPAPAARKPVVASNETLTARNSTLQQRVAARRDARVAKNNASASRFRLITP